MLLEYGKESAELPTECWLEGNRISKTGQITQHKNYFIPTSQYLIKHKGTEKLFLKILHKLRLT